MISHSSVTLTVLADITTTVYKLTMSLLAVASLVSEGLNEQLVTGAMWPVRTAMGETL